MEAFLDLGPGDFDTAARLNPTPLQSALQGAPDRPTAGVVRVQRELFCFRTGGLRLAFDASGVREVVRFSPLTPLPRAPAFLLGVCGHRGEVLPVIDLLRYMQKGELKPAARSRLLVGLSNAFVASFLADSVQGITRIPADEILPPPLGGDAAAEHLDGVIEGKGGESPLHLLNLPRLLQSIHQRVVSR